MIDYQPSHGMRHCHCTDLQDGFTFSTTAETYVHAACRKPRPTVHTNLHELPAPVPQQPMRVLAEVPGTLTVENYLSSEPPVITPEQDAAFTELVQLGQEIENEADGEAARRVLTAQEREDAPALAAAIDTVSALEPVIEMDSQPRDRGRLHRMTEPPSEQPKRRRGRPPKDTKGYALERRDAPDRWCVIIESTGEIVASGLTSKAKATEHMDDLIRKATKKEGMADDSSPVAPVALPAAQPEPDACGSPIDAAEPAAEAGLTAEDVPAAPGQPVGSTVGGVRAVVAGGHPEDQAARGAEDVDQGGAGPAVPGPGSGGDQPVTDTAAAALPAGQGEGGPGGDREDLPGDLGPVHLRGNQLGAGQALTDPAGHLAASMTIHGPKGDCPECFRLWDWCPASVNPEPAQTSPDTSGQGSMPATVALTGSTPTPTPEQTNPHLWPVCTTSAQAPRPAAPASDHASPTHVAPGLLATLHEPSTVGDNPVDNPVDPQPIMAMTSAGPVPAHEASQYAPFVPGSVIDYSRPSLAAVMSAAKHVAQSGNTEWAARYAGELRQIVIDRANNAPRNLQRHLGPSEIGHPCDRNVVGKLVGFPRTNHVTDGWPSIMGTAGHAWMEECFKAHNGSLGWQRFLTEHRVTAHPDHPGTSDLYDALVHGVVDWKFLGKTSMAKLRSGYPGDQYFYQLLTYRRGYQLLGFRVDRIVIVGWPRTESSTDGMYVWEHVCTPEDDIKLDTLFARMEWRKRWAAAVSAGNAKLMDVPAVPDSNHCILCPFYRSQAAHENVPGCPGHAGV